MADSPELEVAPALSSVKIFLGGLSWDTTEETLTTYFAKYGAVEDAVVMRDRNTKMPRGFGFITFKDEASAAAACKETHTIDGKTIDAKPSVPQSDGGKPKGKKLFVGGLASDTSSDDFRSYFEKFGAVTDAQVMYDPNTKRSRGFGFVTYEDEASVQKVLDAGHMHDLGGKQVEVKNATPKGSGGVDGRGPPGFGRGRGAGGGRGYGGGRGFQQFGPPGYQGFGYLAPGPYGFMGGVPPYGAYPGMMMGYGQFGGYAGQPPSRGGGGGYNNAGGVGYGARPHTGGAGAAGIGAAGVGSGIYGGAPQVGGAHAGFGANGPQHGRGYGGGPGLSDQP